MKSKPISRTCKVVQTVVRTQKLYVLLKSVFMIKETLKVTLKYIIKDLLRALGRVMMTFQ
jgi:hypothetical protein